jgi:competence protein ComEC
MGRDTDRRLAPAALAVWLTAWLALALPSGLPVPVCAGAGLGATGLLIHQWRRRPPPDARGVGQASVVAVLAAVLAAGAAAGFAADARVAAIGSGPLPELTAQKAFVTVELSVRSFPAAHLDRPRGSGRAQTVIRLTGEVTRVVARGQTFDVHNPVAIESTDAAWLRLLPGQRVHTTGRVFPPRWRPATTALLIARAPRPEEGPPLRSRAAAAVRANLRGALVDLPADERGLLPGLEFGDTSGFDPQLADDFRQAGLSRLLAMDGAKLAILLAGVLGMARWVGARGRALSILGVLSLAGLAEVVGPKPSLLRAGLMAALALLAPAIGRRNGATAGLCTAVVLLVLIDPWLARSYGFALSVAGTAGLVWLLPWWRARLEGRVPARIVGPLAVAAAAQTACTPVLVLMSGGISLVAVPANLLAAVAVPPALFLGYAAGALHPLSPALAGLIAHGAGLASWWIIEVGRHAGELPGATLPWQQGTTGAALLAVVVGVGVLLARRASTRPPLFGVRTRRLVTVLALLSLAMLIARPNVVPPLGVFGSIRWPPPGWQLVACDVGQGDALVLNGGPGTAVVVDTGPDPRPADKCLRSLGIHRVPYLLLTHFHADHVEGLPGVLHGRTVSEIGVSPLAEPPGEVERVNRWTTAAHVPITHPKVGDVRSVAGLTWRVLWPRELIREGSAPNNASVVLLVTSATGLRMLLTGDIETPVQQALHRAEPDLRVDVLKTAHHGSALQDPEFVRSLGARVAMTSVGIGNVYGHPARWTLALLRGAGMVSGRTDLDGDLAATVVNGRLRLIARAGTVDRADPQPTAPPIAAFPELQGGVRRHGGRRSMEGCPRCPPPPLPCPP